MTSPFEEGSPDSKICILAEAPAKTEMKMGQPLVGVSGWTFNQWLAEAGIPRESLYILNVFEEEVFRDENKASAPTTDKYGRDLFRSGSFTELGLEKARNTLKRLDQCTANVITPLGGTALGLLYGDSRVKRWRGSILESNRLRGRKLVPTFHPQFVLRGNYVYGYVCQQDLGRVKEESVTPRINLPERELIVDPSYSEVKAYLRDMNQMKEVATDVEVLNHQISCLSFAPSPKISMCIPLLDGTANQDRWTTEQEAEIWLLVAKVLANPKVRKINHNLLFDLWMYFHQTGIISAGEFACTMCAHHIIYPDFPKGLDFLTSIHTREPYYKDDGKLWSKPWVDPIKFWIYNAKDSAVAMECWQAVSPELQSPIDHTWAYNRTIDLFGPLLYMMSRGVRMDYDALQETKKRVSGEIEAKTKELRAASDYEFNPNSPAQCQKYFYEHKGIKPYLSLSTRKPTTDDKAMSRLYKRHGLQEAKLVQELRQLGKLFGTYLDINLDFDHRLRCTYNPRGTKFGRLSSAETLLNTGTNMQNLHPEMKEFLVAG